MRTIAPSTRRSRRRTVVPAMRAAQPTDHTIGIDAFLAEEGFIGSNAGLGRRALEEAGITRPGKTGFISAKLDRARAALAARVCERRELLAGDPRRLIEVPRAGCEVCGGSNNAGAVRRMVAACTDAGVRRPRHRRRYPEPAGGARRAARRRSGPAARLLQPMHAAIATTLGCVHAKLNLLEVPSCA